MRKVFVFICLLLFNFLFVYGINYTNSIIVNNDLIIYLNGNDKNDLDNEEENNEEEVVDTSYNGESIEQIGKKIDRLFTKTNLEGQGEFIARTSISKSVNPYLIGGIILESTSCKVDCSILLRQCNNVSGMKGDPGCFGGTYKKYDKIEDGISDLVNKISKDFASSEMQVPNKMFKGYGKNEIWVFKVNKYMEELKKGK